MPQADQRAAFDVDLGPDRADQVLHEALEHDPLEPVEIGPGGTFGLDPLKQLGRKNRQPAPRPAAPAEPEPEEDSRCIWRPRPNRSRPPPASWTT